MHILVTADTVGGVWTYTSELVTELVRRGEQVTLVSFGEIPTAEQTEWMDGLPNLDYRPTAFKLEWMQDSEADLKASAEYLEAVIDESRPDLLHLGQYYYGALKSDVPRVVVAHSDVVSWWVGVHGHEPPDSAWIRWYREVVARGLARASAVVAPSQWMLEQVKRFYGKPAFGSVIYNGRNPALFNPHLTKDDLVLTVGRVWDLGKNASLLFQKQMPIPVCIVGPDKHPESQAFLAEEARLRNSVQLEPQQNGRKLAGIMAKASMYAVTSRYEPFGLAAVEAALSRCAVIASDIPPLRELWDGAAVFFRNNDVESLKQAVTRLLQDRQLRHSYASLAYDRARQRFTAQRMVQDYLALYKAISTGVALTA